MIASNQSLKDPSASYLQWVMSHPEEVAAYLATVRALKQLTVIVIIGGKTYKYPIQFSGENSTVTIPIS